MDKQNLPDDVEKLKEIISNIQNDYQETEKKYQETEKNYQETEKKYQEIETDYKSLKNKYLLMEEKYLILKNKFFASGKSEKLTEEDIRQGQLFNEAEDGSDLQDEESTVVEMIEVQTHNRRKGGRKPIPEDIPREEVVHDLSDEEKRCPCCGKDRPPIGQEESEELDIEPAKIKALKHIKKKYGPCKCEAFQNQELPEIITARGAKRLMPGSIVAPGLLAYVLISKFLDSLPFYRLEKIFGRIGIEISRATMCNWLIIAASKCQELLSLMKEDILKSDLVQMDETTVQVLKEPGRSAKNKSYMWVTLGHREKKQTVFYHYHPSRKGEIPSTFLERYKGYLQTDGYIGYKSIGEEEGIKHVGCLAHIRRYFHEAASLSKKAGTAQQILAWIGKIYLIEKELRADKDLNNEQFVKERKIQVAPFIKKIKNHLDKKVDLVPPESKLGKAIGYALREWKKFIRYQDAWFLTPDNNLIENKIRPFVVGRKNWLFSDTPRGAHASAAIYSLIQTAKANGLEPYRYLKYIFKKLPYCENREDHRKLLPTQLSAEELLS